MVAADVRVENSTSRRSDSSAQRKEREEAARELVFQSQLGRSSQIHGLYSRLSYSLQSPRLLCSEMLTALRAWGRSTPLLRRTRCSGSRSSFRRWGSRFVKFFVARHRVDRTRRAPYRTRRGRAPAPGLGFVFGETILEVSSPTRGRPAPHF